MDVRAEAKHVPMSAQKVRRVISALRGLSADEALRRLQFMPQAAALPVAKVLRSAIANAEENFGLPRDTLYIAEIVAEEGPGVMPGKGWRRRFAARGRWRPIRRRSAHIRVVLNERAED